MIGASCTGGDGERAVPTTLQPAPEPTFDTLPPVPIYAYSDAAGDVIAQIAVDGETPLTVPMLTIYGDGRVIGVFEDEWLEGSLSDVTIQQFFDEAETLGFLGESLSLRGPEPDDRPDIAIELAVDGQQLRHELDLVRIEWPAAPRAFLQRVAVQNPVGLAVPFEPSAWVSCSSTTCELTDERGELDDRPVLPHEEPEQLLADAAGTEP